jgi:uncharacterized membrane protein HdeD (DUF308 family)
VYSCGKESCKALHHFTQKHKKKILWLIIIIIIIIIAVIITTTAAIIAIIIIIIIAVIISSILPLVYISNSERSLANYQTSAVSQHILDHDTT